MSLDFLANILFPPICVACRGRIARGVACKACFSSITTHDSLSCGECFAPFQQIPCHPDFPYILGAAGRYDDKVLQALIHHLKFRSIKAAAGPLAELMADYIARTRIDLTGFVAVPIPLSQRRFRARGYNQSELIARRFSAIFAKENGIILPVATDILIRIKHTKPQSETTSVAERKENIRGVYAIGDSAAAHATVQGAKILLIDDVSTSGSTFLEASRVLKAAGAKTIFAFAAAKT